MAQTICTPTPAQTMMLRPCARAIMLSTGNIRKTGSAAATPATKTFFVPKRSWILAKKNTDTTPFKIPKHERMAPMVGGDSPRPPRAIGVEKNNGCMAR